MVDRDDPGKWLDAWLCSYPWAERSHDAGALLLRDIIAQPKARRVELHKEAVARLPMLRAQRDDPHQWAKGSALYHATCGLYQARLSYCETDICQMLLATKHDCGHGADVKAPFELAIKWARLNGVTDALLSAIDTYVEGLRGLPTVKANDVKTKASLVLLLHGGHSMRGCRSEIFRRELERFMPEERRAWQQFVLLTAMATNVSSIPKEFDQQARLLASFLGLDQVLARLDGWLPTGAEPCRLQTAGSHLLRGFVWLLHVLADDGRVAARCDGMVERMIHVETKPSALGKKIALACAFYFSQRPLINSRAPLEALRARAAAMESTPLDSRAIQKIVDAALETSGAAGE